MRRESLKAVKQIDLKVKSVKTSGTQIAINRVRVAIVMGSKNDWPTLAPAAEILQQFGIAHSVRVVSAHRTPDLLHEFGKSAIANGFDIIIAGAGGAAHLPGMLAALTRIPILAVPIPSKNLNGVDSLLSIVCMPKGVPVPTFAIGEAGSANAALTAVAIFALSDAKLARKLDQFRTAQTESVLAQSDPRESL
jgi:5-(carboxyamino)imidazole ribonucleotide mutase